ncbi:MAG: methyl-accepting chemotaxis protein [Coleofasciculaceae cyanobacterium SM2_1_6]|nr:methyl-accepting chemotaxis protein [Coleofasciculaceae cyanobacterium SM2_1_6]
MKQGLKINQLVPVGFGIVIIVTMITSLMSKSTTDTLIESINDISYIYQVQENIQEIEAYLLAIESRNMGYMFSGREYFLERSKLSEEELKKSIADINILVTDPEQRKRIAEVQPLIQNKIDIILDIRRLKAANREQEMRELFLSNENREVTDELTRRFAEIGEAGDQNLATKKERAIQAQSFLNYVNWGSILIVLIIAILVSIVMTNILQRALDKAVKAAEQVSLGDLTTKLDETSDDDIGKLFIALKKMVQNLNSLIRQVQHSGIQVTTSSTQIAASGKQLEATMTEQVASTNEVVATTREITATTNELVKTMLVVVDMIEVGNKAADGGKKDLARMETTMRQLAAATDSISTKLGIISEKANNINGVVATITKVADQTNLLSLNAAIEAEKAGEYGLGFAVVAREIRRLADQAAIATLDIEQMVKEMQGAVSTGVMEMDKFSREVEQGVGDVQKTSDQLTVIIEQVQALGPQFTFVNQGMEAQAQGTQQISEAMRQLSESSAQTASALRETNSAIEQLNEAAQNLRREVAGFKVQEA